MQFHTRFIIGILCYLLICKSLLSKIILLSKNDDFEINCAKEEKDNTIELFLYKDNSIIYRTYANSINYEISGFYHGDQGNYHCKIGNQNISNTFTLQLDNKKSYFTSLLEKNYHVGVEDFNECTKKDIKTKDYIDNYRKGMYEDLIRENYKKGEEIEIFFRIVSSDFIKIYFKILVQSIYNQYSKISLKCTNDRDTKETITSIRKKFILLKPLKPESKYSCQIYVDEGLFIKDFNIITLRVYESIFVSYNMSSNKILFKIKEDADFNPNKELCLLNLNEKICINYQMTSKTYQIIDLNMFSKKKAGYYCLYLSDESDNLKTIEDCPILLYQREKEKFKYVECFSNSNKDINIAIRGNVRDSVENYIASYQFFEKSVKTAKNKTSTKKVYADEFTDLILISLRMDIQRTFYMFKISLSKNNFSEDFYYSDWFYYIFPVNCGLNNVDFEKFPKIDFISIYKQYHHLLNSAILKYTENNKVVLVRRPLNQLLSPFEGHEPHLNKMNEITLIFGLNKCTYMILSEENILRYTIIFVILLLVLGCGGALVCAISCKSQVYNKTQNNRCTQPHTKPAIGLLNALCMHIYNAYDEYEEHL